MIRKSTKDHGIPHGDGVPWFGLHGSRRLCLGYQARGGGGRLAAAESGGAAVWGSGAGEGGDAPIAGVMSKPIEP